MAKLRVVESRICRVGGGFGRGVEPFVGLGLPLGCGAVLGAEVGGFGLGVEGFLGVGYCSVTGAGALPFGLMAGAVGWRASVVCCKSASI